ncbi:hypothetical protein CQA78_30435, partial [Klebsiella pneumoniae]
MGGGFSSLAGRRRAGGSTTSSVITRRRPTTLRAGTSSAYRDPRVAHPRSACSRPAIRRGRRIF